MEPRWVSVTAKPSTVVIVSTRPEPGTVPLNVTVPAAGASTTSPARAPMSMPRCSPAAYGCAGSKLNGWSTGPPTGHVQARATGATSSAVRTATSSTRRIDTTSVVWNENGSIQRRDDAAALSIEITKLSQSAAVQLVARDAAQPGDDLRRNPARGTGSHELPHRGQGSCCVDDGSAGRDDQRDLTLRR